MGWKELLEQGSPRSGVAPWLGGRKIYLDGRTFRIEGERPRELGWYLFELAGRTAALRGPADPPSTYADGRATARGYLAGDRFIPEKARVDPDPDRLVDQTVPVYLVPRGLDRFAPILVAFDEDRRALYAMQLFEQGVEESVRRAFIDRQSSVDRIRDVLPALDLAFRFVSRQRDVVEAARAQAEHLRLEEEQLERAQRQAGTAAGRRDLAAMDFEAAARAALAVGGAELLDVRPAHGRHEMVVQYRFENRRLECTCDRRTLFIIDSGLCLTDHRTGEKGDDRFTLETLPGVVRQALREGHLVVYRHADGDEDWD